MKCNKVGTRTFLLICLKSAKHIQVKVVMKPRKQAVFVKDLVVRSFKAAVVFRKGGGELL